MESSSHDSEYKMLNEYCSIYGEIFQDSNQPQEEHQLNNFQSLSKKKKEHHMMKFLEYLKCFICYKKVKDPVMCPSCSGFACKNCIHKWIVERKPECPICRKELQQNSVIKCRFLQDFSECLESYFICQEKSVELKTGNHGDICNEHNLKMIYFCITCKKIVCSDCVMFTEQHKGHKFERIKIIFEQKMDQINKEMNELKSKINSHENYLQDLSQKQQDLRSLKEEKAKELLVLYRALNVKLEQELTNKSNKIREEKKRVEEELNFYEGMHEDIAKQLEHSTPAQTINKSNDYLQILMEVNSKIFQQSINNQIIENFGKDFTIPYATGIFFLKPYSNYKKKNCIFNVVYSDPLVSDGITWRIKVYPNGTGIYQSQYLSLFIELVKGWHNGGKYCYKVILVKPGKEHENIEKEYISEFENQICWGYNRFCKIEDIENQGFWDRENDQIILKYQVRASNHVQKIKDQQNYIKYLESKNSKKFKKSKTHTIEHRNRNMSEDISKKNLIQLQFLNDKRRTDISQSFIQRPTNLIRESLVEIRDVQNETFHERIECPIENQEQKEIELEDSEIFINENNQSFISNTIIQGELFRRKSSVNILPSSLNNVFFCRSIQLSHYIGFNIHVFQLLLKLSPLFTQSFKIFNTFTQNWISKSSLTNHFRNY